MNQAASHLADRKVLPGTVQNERLIGRKEQEQGSYTMQNRGLIIARLFSFRGWQGSNRADCLRSAGQVIPD